MGIVIEDFEKMYKNLSFEEKGATYIVDVWIGRIQNTNDEIMIQIDTQRNTYRVIPTQGTEYQYSNWLALDSKLKKILHSSIKSFSWDFDKNAPV